MGREETRTGRDRGHAVTSGRLYSRTALRFLERGAQAHPERVAAADERGRCTYGELFERSRRVGSSLVGRWGRVGPAIVCMEKGVDALVAFFGVLMAGGFYVPVDLGTPPGRARALADALGGAPVIADGAGEAVARGLFPASEVVTLPLLEEGPVLEGALACVAREIVGSDPAYVLFTSGSTGTPKGVAVGHAALVGFVEGFVETFAITGDDVFGSQAPLDFDVSVKDVYGALAAGASVVLLPRRLFSAPATLVDELNARGVTVMVWAVAALCLLSALRGLEHASLPSVRLVMFSGEVMPLAHLERWMEGLPRATFVNLYGPTEVTCNCLYHVVDRARRYEGALPLGDPLPDRRVRVLDGRGREVREPGSVGEVCVGGPGIALGYYGDAARTAEAFVPGLGGLPLPDVFYRTGDLARVGEGGELFFAGRVDNQIKHQGHRVELEEIDAAFERQPGVDRCRSAYDGRAARIYAFYEGDADARELRAAVSRDLVAAVVPSVIERVDAMPLTPNGKVDRRALLAGHVAARAASRAERR